MCPGFSSQQNNVEPHHNNLEAEPYLFSPEWEALLDTKRDAARRIVILKKDFERELPEDIREMRHRRLKISIFLERLCEHLYVAKRVLASRRKTCLRILIRRILELSANPRAEEHAWKQLIVQDTENAKLWAKTDHDSRYPAVVADKLMTLVSLIRVWDQDDKEAIESVITAAGYTTSDVSSFGIEEKETLSALEDVFTLYSERWNDAATESSFPQCSVQ